MKLSSVTIPKVAISRLTIPKMNVRLGVKPALAIGITLLLVNSTFYALMVRPRIHAFENLEGAQSSFSRELAEAEKAHKLLADYTAKLVATETNTEDFYKKILGTKQENMIRIQQEITEIGTEFQISPESVAYNNTDKDEDGLEQFSIQVPVEGDYADLRNFLARIENSKSFLIVDSITLQGTKEGGLQLQLNINITTYFNAPWLKELKRPRRKA